MKAVGLHAVGAAATNFAPGDCDLLLLAPQANPQHGNRIPGDSPSEGLEWPVWALAKAGELAILGVYPETARRMRGRRL